MNKNTVARIYPPKFSENDMNISKINKTSELFSVGVSILRSKIWAGLRNYTRYHSLISKTW